KARRATILPHPAASSRIFWRSSGLSRVRVMAFPALDLWHLRRRILPPFLCQSPCTGKAGPDLSRPGRPRPSYLARRRLGIMPGFVPPLTGERPMSPTLKSLGIDRLSVAQRILLVEEIWDSIAAEAEQAPLTEAQKQDLQRRLAAYEANPKAGSSWEEVKVRLRGQP